MQDDQEAEFLFRKLQIHRCRLPAHEVSHRHLTQVWQDLVLSLEDSEDQTNRDLIFHLLEIPRPTQLEFIAEGAKVLSGCSPSKSSIKNFGIPYSINARQDNLLIGQLYENFSKRDLTEWAEGLWREEFHSLHSFCIIVSLDVRNTQPAWIRLLSTSGQE